jgi:sugar lactone lactonase YvrE
VNGDLPALAYGYAFGFSSYLIDGDEEDTGSGRDITFFNDYGTGFDIWDASTEEESYQDIAYLGNGNLVNYDKVPPDSSFYVDSNDAKESAIGGSVTITGLLAKTKRASTRAKFTASSAYSLQTGDIFCLKLTSVPNAHAWIQITDPGLAGTKGPSFVYRINRTEPYYAYDPVNESLHCIGNASQISPIPTATNTTTPTPTITSTPVPPYASFNEPAGADGLAVNSAGTSIYLSQNFGAAASFNPDIIVWTGSGTSYSASATIDVSGGCPRGLAVDSSGYVYAADSCQDQVEKYGSSGGLQGNFGYYNLYDYSTFPGYLFAPTGVAVDSNGKVYVGENDTNLTVQVFNSASSYVTAWSGGGGDPAIAVNAAGTTVYSAANGGSSINIYSPTGTSLGTLGSGAGTFYAKGIAVAPGGTYAGYVYVTDSNNSLVLEFDTTGAFVQSWGGYGTSPGQFEVPCGIAVDGSGYIYVGDLDTGNVQKFSPR